MTPNEVDALVKEGFPDAYRSGLRCEEMGEGWAIARWLYDSSALRPGDYISGPTLFAAADVALWFATFTLLGPAPMAVTSDLSITFLRPAVGNDVLARAEILRQGRSRIYGEVRLWVDGQPHQLVAHATGSYAPPLP
ncbi:MAG: PaaI family thioesterase [Acidimicrobiia bacterium]|nr:PaaI family thioesterase [Acidimicrobiia bacterium]